MPRYNKQQDFENGLGVLTPFFDSLGFSLSRLAPYRDNEGIYYRAEFARSPRIVQLTHLYSLAPVLYSLRDFSVEHVYYVRALGLSSTAHYPTFEDNSTSAYPALLYDLQTVVSQFFTGSEEAFIAVALPYMEQQEQAHALGTRDVTYRVTQEPRLKARARELFFQRRYKDVVAIESQIRFPERLTNAERQMFALARRRQ